LETRESGSSKTKSRKPGHSLALLEEIAILTGRAHDPQEALEVVVKRIASAMDYDVCSLYSYDPETESLSLAATHGLPSRCIGRVTMQKGEGLVGSVIEEAAPVAVEDALSDPRFKFFPELGEEKYHSFLGAPVGNSDSLLGVLVVQTRRRRHFGSEEQRLIRTAAGQLHAIMINAHLAERLQREENERERFRREMIEATHRLEEYEREEVSADGRAADAEGPLRLSGLGVSPGFGSGRAHRLVKHVEFADVENHEVDDAVAEAARFDEALGAAAADIERARGRMRELVPEVGGAIYEALRLVLEDESLSRRVHERIAEGDAAEFALKRVIGEYEADFGSMTDSYIRERAVDVRDVGRRILERLLGADGIDSIDVVHDDTVLVADELALTDLSSVDTAKLCGIVTGAGGKTSHAAILAKSLEIPTVVGCGDAIENCRQGDEIIVDGNTGTAYLRPGPEVWGEYKRLHSQYVAFQRGLQSLRTLPAETTDGHRVGLLANVGLLSELELADRYGAEGVGLYRTEFQFLSYRDFPSEEEQLVFYRRLIERMGDRPVTIRTLDLGADKYPAYMGGHKEANPFLGWRSIRVSLDLENLFEEQIRAILAAGGSAPLRILFPMITSVEEIRRVREIYSDCVSDLAAKGGAPPADVELGAMIEVPAAVMRVEQIIREVDFLAIGTNDLIQYTLAVDRDNRRVAAMYEPLHPAVLASVRRVVDAAHAAGRRVSMCGEMAANPMCTLFLLGLGLDELSMGPQYIPVIKKLIRAVAMSDAAELAVELLNCETVEEIKGRIFSTLRECGLLELVETYN